MRIKYSFEEEMTPKERWLAVLNRQSVDRIPMDYWATPEATYQLMLHLGIDDAQFLFETVGKSKE